MWYIHPKRFPLNVAGAFYTLGYRDPGGAWCGQCMSCEAPEAEAPNLLAKLGKENYDTYFVKQPETQCEIDAACAAMKVCCVDALRYGGTNASIIQKLGNNPAHTDYIIAGGQLLLVEYELPMKWWQKLVLWGRCCKARLWQPR